eukprot:Sspe_Gene.75824::Locus_47376_Transcript_2_2_Confidence_0.667_Length_1375::g.75824::m.75824
MSVGFHPLGTSFGALLLPCQPCWRYRWGARFGLLLGLRLLRDHLLLVVDPVRAAYRDENHSLPADGRLQPVVLLLHRTCDVYRRYPDVEDLPTEARVHHVLRRTSGANQLFPQKSTSALRCIVLRALVVKGSGHTHPERLFADVTHIVRDGTAAGVVGDLHLRCAQRGVEDARHHFKRENLRVDRGTPCIGGGEEKLPAVGERDGRKWGMGVETSGEEAGEVLVCEGGGEAVRNAAVHLNSKLTGEVQGPLDPELLPSSSSLEPAFRMFVARRLRRHTVDRKQTVTGHLDFPTTAATEPTPPPRATPPWSTGSRWCGCMC